MAFGLKAFSAGVVSAGGITLFGLMEFLGIRALEDMVEAKNFAINLSIFNAQSIAALSYSVPINFALTMDGRFIYTHVFEIHDGPITTSGFVDSVNNSGLFKNMANDLQLLLIENQNDLLVKIPSELTVDFLLNNPGLFSIWWNELDSSLQNSILNEAENHNEILNNPRDITATPPPVVTPPSEDDETQLPEGAYFH